jgi:hypothetical protein
MRLLCLGYNEATGCLFIKSVDDPGSLDSADHRDALAMVKDRIGDCSFMISCARMDDQPWRLIDHKNRLIFEQDIESDILSQKGRWFDCGRCDQDNFIARTQGL